MKNLFKIAISIFCLNAVLGAAESNDTLRVGTKPAPPFVMQNPDGQWSGISIELWNQMAKNLQLNYQIEKTDLEGLLQKTEAGEYDVAVGALTVTSPREERMDFTHPFYVTGLSIAVPQKASGGWLQVLSQFVSLQFFKVILLLMVVLLGVGFLVWLVERKENREQFSSGWKGIGSGLWWSAVTMTTVGYGDKAPVSFWGRLIALVWMFVAIIIISSFTAAIASSLTLSELSGPIQGPSDLHKGRVGTVAQSTSQNYCHNKGIRCKEFLSLSKALTALSDKQLDAVVYDEPILKYQLQKDGYADLQVLPQSFSPQYYGFALPSGHPLREKLNRELIQFIRSPEWNQLISKYLGS